MGTKCGYFIPIQKNLDGFIDTKEILTAKSY